MKQFIATRGIVSVPVTKAPSMTPDKSGVISKMVPMSTGKETTDKFGIVVEPVGEA